MVVKEFKKIGVSPLIALIDLEQFGIEKSAFFQAFRKTFDDLEWDFYDLRKKQFDLLLKNLEKRKDELEKIFPKFFQGERDVDNFVSELNDEVLIQYKALKPWRRRSIYDFSLEYIEDKWNVSAFYSNKFTQDSVDDYRKHIRVFEKMSSHIYSHPLFQKLLVGIATLVREVSGKNKLKITCHQTRVLSYSEQAGSNSPEGIHQDGFPYIVSAFVVQRQNIRGGKSCVFCKDRDEYVFEHTLEPGQGILQEDQGSSLWHYVSDFHNLDPKEIGIRDSFGFDIDL